ncbi:MAG: hypothetical protein PHE56_15010, partial [Bacteroidales bacterium]|nr:hypothetical protein [Bacteroidales bacterium]
MSVIMLGLSITCVRCTELNRSEPCRVLPYSCKREIVNGIFLPITDYRSPITDHRLPITDYRLPITDYRLP